MKISKGSYGKIAPSSNVALKHQKSVGEGSINSYFVGEVNDSF